MTRAVPVPCRARVHAFILTVGMSIFAESARMGHIEFEGACF